MVRRRNKKRNKIKLDFHSVFKSYVRKERVLEHQSAEIHRNSKTIWRIAMLASFFASTDHGNRGYFSLIAQTGHGNR